MARRSKGLRSKSRRKLTKHPRQRGLPPVSKAVQELPVGTRVAIFIDPSVAKGQPHPRYHGRVGVVQEQRGGAYVVEIRDGGSTKKVISRPEHLRMMKQ